MAKLLLTAQNISIYPGDGLDPHARTGATSAAMVKRAGAQGVILGHSEVGDTPDIVHNKLVEVSGEELSYSTVLVGESFEQSESLSDEDIATEMVDQLKTILFEIPAAQVKHFVVGYEPKWGSRGSGRDDAPPPAPARISIVCKKLKQYLSEEFEKNSVPVIYGGRSTPERTNEILADASVDGLILGSACNTVAKTLAIAEAMKSAMGARPKVLHANFKAYDLPDSYEQYVDELSKLDDSYTVYLSPTDADLRAIAPLVKK